MTLQEAFMLGALKRKQLMTRGSNRDIVEFMLKQNPEAKEGLRNICAMILPELFEEVEQTCAFLDMSKREFVEYALSEAVDKANAVMQQVGVLERFQAEEVK